MCLGCLRTSLIGLFSLALKSQCSQPIAFQHRMARTSSKGQGYTVHMLVALFTKRQITRGEVTVIKGYFHCQAVGRGGT